VAAGTDPRRSDVNLLNRRAGFGSTSSELDRMTEAGYENAVDQLVAGLTSPDTAGDSVPVPALAPYQRPAQGADLQQRQAAAGQARAGLVALQDWWVERMIATSTPLREKLTLFWHGHFATGASKVRDPKLMYLQNDLFRRLGAGSFEQLTQAVAKDGAMMVWLDTGSDKKAHPNENFARELMELFTIGIGNYTQGDVTAAAGAFSGWTYDRLDYQYRFRPGQHDYSSKTFLGQTGDFNGEDVVTILVHEEESGRFVLAKLWSHFAYPVTPGDAVVSDLLDAYGPELDVASALRALFLHPDFRSDQTRTGLVKQPVEWVVGAARSLGLNATASEGPSLAAIATALGQQLFNPPNVGGWGQNNYWLNTATAQLRLQVALLLARRADLTSLAAQPPRSRADALAGLLGIDGWGATSRAALDSVADQPDQLVALGLVSPEYVLA
jgi:uncharacterized protein (DUF1800 family)